MERTEVFLFKGKANKHTNPTKMPLNTQPCVNELTLVNCKWNDNCNPIILECNKCIWLVGDHYCMINTSLGFHWSRSLGIFLTPDGVWSDLYSYNLANTCGQNSDVLLNIAKHWDATDFGTFRHEVDRLHFPFQLEPLSSDKWGKRMQTPLTNGLLGIYDLAKAKINIKKQLLATNDCMTAKKYHKVICHQTREIQEWTLPFMFPCCQSSLYIQKWCFIMVYIWVFDTS